MMKNSLATGFLIFSFLFSFHAHAQHSDDAELKFRLETAGAVLLKNHGGILPLDTGGTHSIAVIGAGIHFPVVRSRDGVPDLIQYVSPFKGISTRAGRDMRVLSATALNMRSDVQPLDTSMVYIGQGICGFSAKYYNNLQASGSPARFATDKYIDFNWGEEIPYPELDSNAFSVKWDATLIPTHGPVKVKLIHTDGVRMYLDGKLLIDAWETGPLRADSAWINIVKGRSYNLQIDYFTDGNAQIRFGFEYLSSYLLSEALEKARLADYAIVFVDQPLVNRGVGDRNLCIPDQSRLVRQVYEANPNTIVVLQTPSRVDIESWAFDIPAIIHAGPPGMNSGAEIADIIFGNTYPSARISYRWAMNENQNFATRFPKGFGMSYTTIGIGKLMMRRERDNSGWLATAEIRNVGNRSGTEWLQIYLKYPGENTMRQEIKAFKAVNLLPGQKKTVGIHIPYKAFEQPGGTRRETVIMPGKYEVLLGTSAEDIKLRKTIELKENHINQYYGNE